MSPHASPPPDALLAEWIDIDSVTGREGDYLDALEAHFATRRWHVTRQTVVEGARRDNLMITAAAHVTAPRLLLSTHVDTVPPHLPYRLDGDKLRGRGACDTKGGLVAMSVAAERLRERHGESAVGLLLVVGEEVDHCGAIAARELDLTGVEHVVLCEPTRNRLVSHQKGLLKVRVSMRGVAAHSAFPDRGVSAVDRLLDLLAALRRHDGWDTHPVLGPTTTNIGLISGGVAANVLAPAAEATLMIRLVGPSQHVLDILAQCAEATGVAEHLELDIQTRLEPRELFVPPGDWATTTAAFNSDAVHLAVHAPVTMVGPGDIERAHSVDEHITRDELRDGIELYVRLGEHLLGSA